VLNSALFSVQHFWVPWSILFRFFGALPYVYFAQRKKNIHVGVGVHVIVNLLNALAIAAVISRLSVTSGGSSSGWSTS
jgi:hypothetical protein